MPFIVFERQLDLINFLHACLRNETNGLFLSCRSLAFHYKSRRANLKTPER